MTALLSEVSASDLSVGPSKKSPTGILTSQVLYKGERSPSIQLDGEVTCPFAPSAFDGGTRLSVSLSVDEATAKSVEALETALVPNAHSAIKRKDGLPPSFRVKYDPEQCQFLDASNAAVPEPPEWRGLRLRAMVSPRSTYKQVAMEGVTWHLVAVQVLGAVERPKLAFR